MFQQSWLLVVRDRSMNPVITKMKCFVIIVDDFLLLGIVTKSSILNVLEFLYPPLHCNKLVMMYAYLRQKYLDIN